MDDALAVVRRVPRWLRSLVVAVGLVYLAYLLAANVLLRTRLLRHWLSTDERSLLVDYASARSFYPGHVVVHDLRIRFQDRNVEMSIALDRASLDIDFWQLAHRVARFDGVRAEGVVYRLRTKMDDESASDRRVKAFPPIAGLPDPPRKASAPPPPSSGPSWTIEVRDIQAFVRDVWTLEYRFRGNAILAGGFHIEPGHTAYVTPSSMIVRDGVLSLGDRDLVRGGSLSIAAQVEPFAPGGPHGLEILRYMHVVLHQHDGALSLAALGDTYLPEGTTLEGGGGKLDVDVDLDHGIVRSDSRVTYRSDSIGLRSVPFAVSSDVDIVVSVDGSGERPRVVAQARTARAAMIPATEIRDLEADLAFSGVDVTAPIVMTRLAAGFASAQTPDLRVWQPVAHDALTFDGGAVTCTAHGVYGEGGTLEGRIETTLDKVAITIGPFGFVSSGTTEANVASRDVSKSLSFPAAKVDLHDIAVRLLGGHAEGMWLRARSADTVVATSGKTATDSDIAVTSGPGDQTVKLFTRIASLPDVAADVTHGTQLDARVHLRVRHGEIALDVLGAHNGALDGRGRLVKRDSAPPSGAFLLNVGPIFAGLDIDRGKVSIRPLASGAWLEETLSKR